jgi:hypothetical protein
MVFFYMNIDHEYIYILDFYYGFLSKVLIHILKDWFTTSYI